MRTGILGDEHATSYQPLDVVTNERFLGHLHTYKKQSRKRKHGYKNTHRSRYPQHAHHDLAQLVDPLNIRPHVQVFENQARSYANPRPTQSFQAAVKSFRQKYPDLFVHSRIDNNPQLAHLSRNWKNTYPETAYFFQKLGIDPMKYMVSRHNTISDYWQRMPLHKHAERVWHDHPERSVEIEKLYDETMEQFLGDASFDPDKVRPNRVPGAY